MKLPAANGSPPRLFGGTDPIMHVHASHHGSARRRLLATLAVTASIMVAELVGGWLSSSLALLADAGHMLTDLLALLVAFAAVTLSARPADDRRTYGYRRLEVLAALVNSLALVVISICIVFEAFSRWRHPQPVQVGTMMGVAGVGLIANLLGLWLLRESSHSLSMRGAFLHILGDTLSSLGVVVGGGIIALTGWTRIDPLLSVGISLVIIVSSWHLLREVVDVLLESVPRGIDTDAVRRTISAVAGVREVHDLHIWSITSGMPALSAHVMLDDHRGNPQAVRLAIVRRLRDDYAIEHATLQIETEAEDDCAGC